MDCAPVVHKSMAVYLSHKAPGNATVLLVPQYVQLYDLSQVTPSLCCMFVFLLCAVYVCIYSVCIYSVCIDSLCIYSVCFDSLCIYSVCYLRHVCL